MKKTPKDISKIKLIDLSEYSKSGDYYPHVDCNIILTSGKTVSAWAEWEGKTSYPTDPGDFEFVDGSSHFDDYYSPTDVFCAALEKIK